MSNTSSPEFRFKIAMCGDWAVGKTSLVNRYATDTFSHDYLSTISVNFVVKEIVVDGIPISLTIWDTGGQERFRQLRQRYYRNSNGVVFAFDLTRPVSFRNVERRWLPEVQGILDDYVPALWGTKVDLTEQRVVRPGSGERLARSIDCYYHETSALTGENVEKAFTSLARLMLSKSLSSSKPTKSFTV